MSTPVISLSIYAVDMLKRERDLKAKQLRAQADDIAKMSAHQFLANGISVHTSISLELVGRLAKAGWTSVHGRSGEWMANMSTHLEYKVDREDVERVLNTPEAE